jgi:hypothetical protein
VAGWRKRWEIFTSFVICAVVVVLGTLLYPLVFLLFLVIALIHPDRWRPASGPPAGGEEGRQVGRRG